MFDKVRIETLLNRIENAILLIQCKAGQLETPNDFLLDQEGSFLLSGVCMQLIFIGESIKTIDNKTSHAYLTNYPDICWTQIMGLRDIIVHEYHRIDEEEIFNIIKTDLSPLLLTILLLKVPISVCLKYQKRAMILLVGSMVVRHMTVIKLKKKTCQPLQNVPVRSIWLLKLYGRL